MRALSLTLVLWTLTVGAGCDRAEAALDEEVSEQRLTDSSEAVPRPGAATRVEQAVPPAEPQVVTQTNIKRDAAIGAGLGAAVGAITNEDNRVKGALVGGVIGGAAGAIAGATVDKKEKVVDSR